MSTTTSPNDVEHRTLNLEQSSSVEPRTLNIERSSSAIAVIGAGYWGKNLVRNFHQLGVLKTICDGAHNIREDMAKTYPDVAVTDDINGVLQDTDIHAIVIAAPAALHYEIAEKALNAGKHVFVEKPLSLNQTCLPALRAFSAIS